MDKLAGYQRRHLRGLAHGLKPAVIVGGSGLSGPVLQAIDQALANHELIKIRFGDFHETKKSLAAEIGAKLQCEVVGMVGHVAICYRPHPDAEKRRIEVPKRDESEDS